MGDEDLRDSGAPDADAPPSEEEVAASDALRRALEDPDAPETAESDLARALRAAHAPRPIDEASHRAIVERALTAPGAERARQAGRGGRVIRVVFGGAAALALAAGVLLAVNVNDRASAPLASRAAAPRSPAAVVELRSARSTQPLFTEPFGATAAAARIDRIAMARASDLRENRFARWGVR
jgi:hypothetical protein